MKQIILAVAALMMTFNLNAQVVGIWTMENHPADELLGTAEYMTFSFVSHEMTFTIYSNEMTDFLIGYNGNDVFVTNTPTTNNVKVIIGLYDEKMQLVRKLDYTMFQRTENPSYLRGHVNFPKQNKRWVECHKDLNRYIREEKGYIRIVANMTEGRKFDYMFPTMKQAQEQPTNE